MTPRMFIELLGAVLFVISFFITHPRAYQLADIGLLLLLIGAAGIPGIIA